MISVIVPIYNIKQYISKCFESIINQTYKDMEIILVDDGSTDGSELICDAYAKKDDRIKVIHKKNEGAVRARKTGLENATGDYIAYVDGDDWIEHDMIAKLYDALTEQKVDIAMCGRFEDTGDTQRPVYHGLSEGRYDKQALMDIVYPNMIVNGAFFEWGIFPGLWDKLFRRECLEEYHFAVDDRLTMGDDAACTYPCLLNADSIYILHECLYHYRQSMTSMVKRTSDKVYEREKFEILYETVMDSLTKYKHIFDLRKQWREYLLFLMVPRADSLYRGIEELGYLFPFPNVKKGSRVIIYGAGTYGQRLYKYLTETQFCDVAALVDQNYVELHKQGVPVVSPEDIPEYDYDAIVVASSFARTRDAIYKYLTQLYPKEKVHIMDVDLILSEDTCTAFGISE